MKIYGNYPLMLEDLKFQVPRTQKFQKIMDLSSEKITLNKAKLCFKDIHIKATYLWLENKNLIRRK